MIFEYKNAKGQTRKWVLQQYVIAGLRRLSYRTPMRAAALTKARIRRGVYKCAICGKEVKKSQIALDHINPVVPITGWDDWNGFINRLFCAVTDLQVICKDPCHALKTKYENAARRLRAKAKK